MTPITNARPANRLGARANRLAWIGLALACVGTLFCVSAGWLAFDTRRHEATKDAYSEQEALVHHLSKSAEGSNQESRVSSLMSAWGNHSTNPSGYLCVINGKGKLLANTRRPTSVGRDVGHVRVRDGAATVADLLLSKQGWTGRNVNAAGEEQVAAYVYHPEIQGLVAHHLAASTVDAQVVQEALPWGIGLAGALLLLLLSSFCFVFATLSLRRELKAVAEQASARNSLESMGLLVSGVAHDFNNLLTIIIGHADLLEAKYKLPELRVLQAAGIQAAAMTSQLLTLSRPAPTPEEGLDLNVVLAESSRLLNRVLPKNLELGLSLGNDLPLVVLDRGELNQIVLNLAINARDAMPAGGSLDLGTSLVSLSADQAATAGCPPGGYVRLEVTDEGEGIPPEILPLLFEPFFTTKAAESGTGIGLATVGSIAQRRGLGLRVTSTLGQGSRFEVFFPS